ncbi:hypothetical protein ACGFIU_09220 [Rhodococcus oryzae]|uniref:hypothetical protein n=1 Tax=Rhodococcus oryzae TaxID=2571143 RepID=UPI0037240D42
MTSPTPANTTPAPAPMAAAAAMSTAEIKSRIDAMFADRPSRPRGPRQRGWL